MKCKSLIITLTSCTECPHEAERVGYCLKHWAEETEEAIRYFDILEEDMRKTIARMKLLAAGLPS